MRILPCSSSWISSFFIAVTATCSEIPPPLIDQLRIGGRLIAPVLEDDRQNLTLLEKGTKGVHRHINYRQGAVCFIEGCFCHSIAQVKSKLSPSRPSFFEGLRALSWRLQLPC